MADDEGNPIRSERTDLNLYLGFPRTGVEEEDESTAMSAAPPPPSDDPPPPPPPPPPPMYPFYPPDGHRRPEPVDLAELLRQLDDDPVLPAAVEEGHALYSRSHLTLLSARPYLPLPMPDSGSSARASDGPSPPQQFLQNPESRFRRLIESNRRIQITRVIPSTTEQLMRGIVSTQTQKHRGRPQGIAVEGSEGEEEDKSISAANFECNICLNMAKDPVVTSCGHLFCWPCLYQWLHIHSDHHECPVCKGHVDDAKLTPIYGRGSSEAAAGKRRGDEGELGLKIPPRPHGHRIDSLRQQLQRPISRRLREGSPTSWSRILEDENAHLQNLLDIAHNMVLSRLGEIRRQTEEVNNIENGLNVGHTGMPGNNTLDPQISTTTSLPDELNHGHQPPLYSLAGIYRLASDSTELVRVAGRFENGSIPAGTSTSSVNNHAPEPLLTRALSEATLASSQAYASSTMAVIQGDTAVNEAAADTYSAGPSRSHRRRGRSGTSGSLDADGELHVRKRRRLN